MTGGDEANGWDILETSSSGCNCLIYMLLQQAAHVGFVEAMDDDAMIQTCKEVRSFIMEKGPLPRTPNGHDCLNREEYLEDHRHAKVIWEWFSKNLSRGSLAETNVKVTLITHSRTS